MGPFKYHGDTGPPREESGPSKRKIPPPLSKGGPATNVYAKSGRLAVSYRVSWDWSGRINFNNRQIIVKNSVALVRERTIPTERPPPVDEVSTNFCG